MKHRGTALRFVSAAVSSLLISSLVVPVLADTLDSSSVSNSPSSHLLMAQANPRAGKKVGNQAVKIPPGLERLAPRPLRPPVVLVPGLYLSPQLFSRGPAGGLAAWLDRHGYEVWLWNPWQNSPAKLENMVQEASHVAAIITEANGEAPLWVGVELGGLVGLLTAERGGAIKGVASLSLRARLDQCTPTQRKVLAHGISGAQGELISTLSSVWSWGDVSSERLTTVLVQDVQAPSPSFLMELAGYCEGKPPPLPRWDRLWLPTFFLTSPRDGNAPAELVIDQYDRAPKEMRRLEWVDPFPAPSHLGVLLADKAVGWVYRPLLRWMRSGQADTRTPLPMVPAVLNGAVRGKDQP